MLQVVTGCGVFCFYLLAAVLWLAPYSLDPAHTLPMVLPVDGDWHDSLTHIWILVEEIRAVSEHPARLLDGNMFWPAHYTLAFSEYLLSAQWLFAILAGLLHPLARPPAWRGSVPPPAAVSSTGGRRGHDIVYIYYALFHRQPLRNGFGSFFPPWYDEVRHFAPTPIALQNLRTQGVALILVHGSGYRPAQARALRTALEQSGGLQRVAQVGEDVLYQFR